MHWEIAILKRCCGNWPSSISSSNWLPWMAVCLGRFQTIIIILWHVFQMLLKWDRFSLSSWNVWIRVWRVQIESRGQGIFMRSSIWWWGGWLAPCRRLFGRLWNSTYWRKQSQIFIPKNFMITSAMLLLFPDAFHMPLKQLLPCLNPMNL